MIGPLAGILFGLLVASAASAQTIRAVPYPLMDHCKWPFVAGTLVCRLYDGVTGQQLFNHQAVAGEAYVCDVAGCRKVGG